MEYKLEEQKSAKKMLKLFTNREKKLPNCLMIILNTNLGLNIDRSWRGRRKPWRKTQNIDF